MRILLIRTSALGDVVHCLPVLTALRRQFPDATLGWVVEAAMAPILQGHPDLDTLITVRLRRWRHQLGSAATWREIRAAFKNLRAFQADLVLDLMGNHKAGLLTRLSGCRRRIGLRRDARREPSSAFWINEEVPPGEGAHAVDRALDLLSPLEVPRAPVDFGGDKLFRGARPPIETKDPYILLPPGAGWHNKRYPAASWGAVAQTLRQRAGFRTLIPCGPGEEPLADRVVAASGGAARSLGLVDLPGLAALMRGAALVLGSDSGPTHLAHALGASVLCVLGPTDPQRHGPYGEPRRSLSRRLPCSYCYRRFDAPKACLLTLPPSEVAEHALSLLQEAGQQKIHKSP